MIWYFSTLWNVPHKRLVTICHGSKLLWHYWLCSCGPKRRTTCPCRSHLPLLIALGDIQSKRQQRKIPKHKTQWGVATGSLFGTPTSLCVGQLGFSLTKEQPTSNAKASCYSCQLGPAPLPSLLWELPLGPGAVVTRAEHLLLRCPVDSAVPPHGGCCREGWFSVFLRKYSFWLEVSHVLHVCSTCLPFADRLPDSSIIHICIYK